MNDYQCTKTILLDIQQFVSDFIQLFLKIHESSDNSHMLDILFNGEKFLLPATFNEMSQRAHDLQERLRILIRNLTQQRRIHILKGIDDNTRMKSAELDMNFKNHLEQLQRNSSDNYVNQIIRSVRLIVEDFELYANAPVNCYSSNTTFYVSPILYHIQKQVMALS